MPINNRRQQGRAPYRKEIQGRYKVLEVKEQLNSDHALAKSDNAANYFYAGLDPRRRQEIAEGGMVQEDNNFMANLSPRFIHREYPEFQFFHSPYIDDTMPQE